MCIHSMQVLWKVVCLHPRPPYLPPSLPPSLPQDLIHGAPIGRPVASRAKVTAVYGIDDEEDGEEIAFSRM